jgi:hypothetical protein
MSRRADEVRVTAGFAYVLVVEWLGECDEPTGSQLHDYLHQIGFSSELAVCRSAADVRESLARATERVRATGAVPIVHLEVHGSNPWESRAEAICFGPGEGEQAVTWAELGDWLTPLNVATDFNLMIVSAACWGSAVIGGISGGTSPLPFAFAVGFRTPVDPGRLRDAMREFYRAVHRGDELRECVNSAQRELAGDQMLELEIALALAVEILRTGLYGRPGAPRHTNLDLEVRLGRARDVWDLWFPPDLQERKPAYRFVRERFERQA